VGAAILLLLVGLSLAAPLLTGRDPDGIDPTVPLQAPSWEYPLGTDHIGRDLWARFLYGGRLSLRVGLLAIALGATVGIGIGLLAGYYGGWIDAASSWLSEVLLSFPDILLALAIIAVLGPGITNAMLAIGLAFIPSFARLTRGHVLAIRELGYVEAARAIGVPDWQILLRHVLPNTLRTLLVLLTLGIGSAILSGAALSFLGLGAQPPEPSWGNMLSTGRGFMAQAPWLAIVPGAALFVGVLGFNLLGDGLRDFFDPRMKD
jgi:peptide/nickel transport system permease protein